MARRRDFVRGAAAIGRKRETTWFSFEPANANIGTAGDAVLVFALNAAALALRPFTIVRTRFLVAIRSDQAAAIEVQRGAVGLAVVSDQAVAVGVTAVPTPIDDMGSNLWFVHQLLYADESNLTDRTRGESHFEIDSKAQRKVEVGQDVIVVAESSSTVSAGLIMTIGGRMLIKNS